jgi:hypothetical protein
MKGGLVAMIYAARVIKECGIKLNDKIGSTIVALCPDKSTTISRACSDLTLASPHSGQRKSSAITFSNA